MVEVLDALKEATHLGVEIQLKILQSLPSLIQNYGDFMFNKQIVELLLICYILQGGNKIPAVVNTALATLQQLIISVFDKVVKEDNSSVPLPKTFEVPVDNNDKILVSPAAYDALRVFFDICNLIEHQKPLFLQFGHLPETVGLELIESILTTHSDIFINHVEFCYVLRTRAVPLLLRAFSEKRDFPVTVRVTRILYLLIRKQLSTLVVECEVILSLLTHMLEPEAASYWKRVLCMEVFQGVCSEFSLIQNIYSAYDFQDGRRAIVKSCVLALDKLSAEQPNIIGLGKVSTPLLIPDESSRGSNSSSIAGLADFSNGSNGRKSLDLGQMKGISVKTSSVRSSCIDLLDKSEPPNLPQSYLYYLALQCINSLSEGLARSVFASSFNDKKRGKLGSMPFTISQTDLHESPRSRSPSPTRAKRQSISANLQDQIVITTSFVGVCWPELLSAYTTFFQATMDSEMYRALVRSAQKFTHASGILGLSDSRDAFLSLLGRFSVTVADPIDNLSLPSPKPGLLSMETLVGSLSPTIGRDHSRTPSINTLATTIKKPQLTARNVLCFRALLNLGIALGPSLGQGWAILLETIQYSNFLINGINADKHRGSVSKGQTDYSIEFTPLPFSQLGNEFQTVENSIRRLLDSSKEYSVTSFYDLIFSITNLSSLVLNTPSGTPRDSMVVAGIGKLEDCDPLFLLDFLGAVCNRNAFRFVTLHEQEIKTWNLLTNFLITVQTTRQLNPDYRIRASQVLNEVILKNSLTASEFQKEHNSEDSQRGQNLVLRTLTEEVKKVVQLGLPADGTVSLLTTESKLHVMAIDYLNKILDQCGGTLQQGWDIVFDIIDTVFFFNWLPKNTSNLEVQSRRLLTERSVLLVKSGFESLQLICNDFLENLPTTCLNRLIDTLFKFCTQDGDLNISFTSISFFWILSDNLRALLGNDISVDLSTEITTERDLFEVAKKPHPSDCLNALWIIALLRLAGIAYDSRPQVRNGAVQILFRIFEAHGGQLPPLVWKACQVIVLEDVMNQDPFETPSHSETYDTEWCETLALTFSGFGNIYSTFMSSFVKEPHFEQQWTRLLNHFLTFSFSERLSVSLSVYKSLYTILEGVSRQHIELPESCIDRTWDFWVCQSITPNKLAPKAAQDAYTALVELHAVLTGITSDFPAERISKSVVVLEKCATYPVLSPYSSDKDHLSPLQSAALKEIESIKLDSVHNTEQILRLVAKLVALPFDETTITNINEAPNVKPSKEQYRRPTFVSLSVHSLKYLKKSLDKAKQFPEIFVNGTATHITEALLIPIYAKFDTHIIPPGKPEMWQLATIRFLEVVDMTISVISTKNQESEQEIQKLWDLFSAGVVGILMPGCNALRLKNQTSIPSSSLLLPSPELASLQASAEYEKFDIESYKTFMQLFVSDPAIPSSGKTIKLGVKVPNSFWVKVLETLFQASFIYEMPRFLSSSSSPVITSLHDSDSRSSTASSGTMTTGSTVVTVKDDDKVSSSDDDVAETQQHQKQQQQILPPREAISYIVTNTFFGSTDKLVPRPRQNLAYICMTDLASLATTPSGRANKPTDPALAADADDTNVIDAAISIRATEYITLRVALVLYLYITDQPLRGSLPMPKVQRRELVSALDLVINMPSSESLETSSSVDKENQENQHDDINDINDINDNVNDARRKLSSVVPLFPLIVKAIRVAERDAVVLELLQRLLLKIGWAQSILL